MFEDIEDEELDFDAESSDRLILYAIHYREVTGDLSPADGWAILFERYPDDPRMLLLAAHETANETEPEVALRQLARLRELAVGEHAALSPRIDDLWTVMAHAHPRKLRSALGKHDVTEAQLDDALSQDEDAARQALVTFSREVVRECHDRTAKGGPIREVAPTAPARRVPNGPARPYSPTTPFEEGDTLSHAKFGKGVVDRKLPGKIEVLFGDVRKTLVSRAEPS